MSDIKLFRLIQDKASELKGEASELDRSLQRQIEANLELLLGIRLLASDYGAGKSAADRIDTLGLDENHSPVILKYKQAVGENVIHQGLFYLDWLLDHQAEFKLLVLDVLGKSPADALDWSSPRLVCIAPDFTRYDAHAVQQINRNIELIRFRRFGSELLLLELANTVTPGKVRGAANAVRKIDLSGTAHGKAGAERSFADTLQNLPATLADLLHLLEDYCLTLGDDVQRNELKQYVAFKRLKNFASVALQRGRLLLYLHTDPAPWVGKLPSARDVRRQGHSGTGDLELSLCTAADLEAAKPLIALAYEGHVETVVAQAVEA
ncbi:MAG: DUF91 domain-containing protein [Pseudomonadota bacterium]|nr:DUF91 domain-containing protein [Pseudomonadota bacterium]